MVEGIIRDIKADREETSGLLPKRRGLSLHPRREVEIVRHPRRKREKNRFRLKGNIWVATHGGGILRIHPQTGAISRFLLDSETKNRSDNDVNIILPLNSSRLLIGTSNKGVLQFDLTRERFMPFLEKGATVPPST